MLGKRYKLLGLLGKGGFSEVYKVNLSLLTPGNRHGNAPRSGVQNPPAEPELERKLQGELYKTRDAGKSGAPAVEAPEHRAAAELRGDRQQHHLHGKRLVLIGRCCSTATARTFPTT